MIDWNDGDQLLRVVGIVLAGLLIAGIAVLLLAGSMPSRQAASAPDVEWQLTPINGSHAEIRHTGGDPVSVGNLRVTVGGTPTQAAWSNEVLLEGESAIVRAGRGDRVAILWHRGPRVREVLERWNR